MVNSRTRAARRSIRDDETVVVLPVNGELDICTVPQLRARAEGLLASGAQVALDVNGLTFIDACGLTGLLTLEASAALQGRPLLVLGRSPALDRVLFLTGMLGRFPAPAATAPAHRTCPLQLSAAPANLPRPA